MELLPERVKPGAALLQEAIARQNSMVLAELVEMLKFKYAAEVPEQWIYFESTTIQQVQVAVRNGGVSEDEVKEGQILEVKTEQKNQLLETCPCFLMCCPGLVLGRR